MILLAICAGFGALSHKAKVNPLASGGPSTGKPLLNIHAVDFDPDDPRAGAYVVPNEPHQPRGHQHTQPTRASGSVTECGLQIARQRTAYPKVKFAHSDFSVAVESGRLVGLMFTEDCYDDIKFSASQIVGVPKQVEAGQRNRQNE